MSGGEGGVCGVEKYAFNEAIARRRLYSTIVITVILCILVMLMQWARG